ncbi:hypothetical protein ACFE04_008450 [Oxalis oulophora]
MTGARVLGSAPSSSDPWTNTRPYAHDQCPFSFGGNKGKISWIPIEFSQVIGSSAKDPMESVASKGPQVIPPKSSVNGFGRRREGGNRQDNKMQAGKSNTGRVITAVSGGKVGALDSPSRDRLVYLTTCLIGHPVEVQVKNGSVYSGIYHATNTEKDFGVVLKMSRMIKDGASRGQKSATELLSEAPSKTFIIPGKELVQVIAKDVAVTSDGFSNEFLSDKQQDLMLDSFISQSRHVDLDRELAPWMPDEDDLHRPGLDNIFDNPWNRSWDQFETNKALFGVESTFNEELYTTKLEKGPRMRELEREAMRIAREIEDEDTQDLHLAEERGMELHGSFDIDEEARFSSVQRVTAFDDSGFEEEEDILLDSRNTETFGGPSDPVGKSNGGAQVSSGSSLVNEAQSSQTTSGVNAYRTGSAWHLASENESESSIREDVLDEQGANDNAELSVKKQMHSGDAHLSKSESLQSGDGNIDDSDGLVLPADVTIQAPPRPLQKGNEKTISTESPVPGKTPGETVAVNSYGRPTNFRPPSSERTPASARGLSPSSSVGSLSSEKSTLNPYAKEFKLNPNAKSFSPTQPAVRPQSPVSDGSFYYPANPHMHAMPVGYGQIAPSFAGHQPVMFNPQVAPPQAYFQPNGPQYGQQHMLIGQPRQVVYMPGYQQEMQYKGRDY